MRVLACAAVLAALTCVSTGGAAPAGCAGHAGLGTLRYARGTQFRELSLATCADRTIGKAPEVRRGPVSSRDGRYTATIVSSKAKETIVVVDHRLHTRHSVFAHFTDPVVLLSVSGDGRWVFFSIDPDGSGSIAADGLTLRAVSTRDGTVASLGVALPYPDYLTWCGGRLVWIGGADRVAIHAKQLLVSSPPDWRPKPLWADRSRSFASPACAPDGGSVAVLSQRSSDDANFFHTRWRLWRVGLDGAHHVLDVPPSAAADEQPIWSGDGRSILFVRERHGHGAVMLWHAGRISGPLASLGYGLGYYGHHAWQLDWSAAA
ncbi:MAG TPA: hypothetical protein VGQ38_07785 [Gaiellaceae bacterium]|nr:hypothetical protein [Gaiellaceae bacterium]